MVKQLDGIRAGGRKFKRLLGQVLVVDCPPWSLYLLPVSPCGKYQGIRLYLDVKKAPKNVWFLSRYVSTKKLIGSRDLKILQEFYPGMELWLKNALEGIIEEPPVDGDNGRQAAEVFPVVRKDIPEDAYERILEAIEARWQAGQPLSIAPQTRLVGRFAPDVLAPLLDLPPLFIRETIERAVADGVVVVSVYNKRLHLRGLQTTRMVQQRDAGWREFVAQGLAGPRKAVANA